MTDKQLCEGCPCLTFDPAVGHPCVAEIAKLRQERDEFEKRLERVRLWANHECAVVGTTPAMMELACIARIRSDEEVPDFSGKSKPPAEVKP